MEYKVELESFQGPLDLLLFLVKRNEVDICDIPIAQIAGQFLEYLNVLQLIDVEWAGDFLVLAATLMEIKSRMLLPRPEEMEHEHDDPRLELVKQLLEYKRFKEAANLLEAQAEKQLTRMPRMPVEMPTPVGIAEQPLHQVELWDLVSAFGRLMRETSALQPRQIVMDETPIHVHMASILERLAETPYLSFADVFVPPRTRGRLLGLFLATLELIKSKKIEVVQMTLFSDIGLTLAAVASDPSPSESVVDTTPSLEVTTPEVAKE